MTQLMYQRLLGTTCFILADIRIIPPPRTSLTTSCPTLPHALFLPNTTPYHLCHGKSFRAA